MKRVTLTLVEEPLRDTHTLHPVVADLHGNIISTEFVPDADDLGVRFYLTAASPTSQAQTSFTDANNDAHVAPGWAPTNTPTTFSSLYRVTTGATVQHVRIKLPTGYTNISVPATAFSSGTWGTASVAEPPSPTTGNGFVDVSLTGGTGLAVGGWARIDVTATTPGLPQSGNAAEWLMSTFTNAAGTGSANQDDNPPVLIGNIDEPVGDHHLRGWRRHPHRLACAAERHRCERFASG